MITRKEYLAVRDELAWLFTPAEMETLEHGAPTIAKLFREREIDHLRAGADVDDIERAAKAMYDQSPERWFDTQMIPHPSWDKAPVDIKARVRTIARAGLTGVPDFSTPRLWGQTWEGEGKEKVLMPTKAIFTKIEDGLTTDYRQGYEDGACVVREVLTTTRRELTNTRRELKAASSDGRLQAEITQWSNDRFAPDMAHLRTKLEREFQELRGTLIRAELGDDPGPVSGEVADVMHLLFQIAENYEFDLIEATRKKFEVNKARSWEAQPDGTYQHVEVSDANG